MIKIPFHYWVAASAWISKIVSASVQVISIRFLISYLGIDGYGAFVVLLSLSGWFALSDFGLGSSVQNFVSEYRARNKDYKPVLEQTVFLILICLFFFAIFTLIIFYPLGNALFSKLPQSVTPAKSIILLAGIIWIITALSSVSYRVFYAEQRGYLSNIFPAIGNIFVLLLLYLLSIFKPAGNKFVWAVCVYCFPLCLLSLTGYFYTFKKLIPPFSAFDKTLALLILNRSWKFWGFSIMSAGVLQIDYFVMSQMLNVRDIAVYNIISKVFMLIFFIYSAVLSALWPSCTEYMERKDFDQVKKMIRQSLLFGLLLLVGGTSSFLIFSQFIAGILSPEPVIIPVFTVVLFGIYYLLRVWSDIFSIVLVSVSRIKIFWIYLPFQALLSFTFQYVLSKKFGINGIVSGLCFAFIFTSVWILPVFVKREFKIRGSYE